MVNKNQVVIYGRHAVKAALENPNRKIVKVMCLRENTGELKGKIAENKIFITDKKELEKLLPQDAVHQGFVAIADMLNNIFMKK